LNDTKKRLRAARASKWAWYAQVPIGAGLSLAAVSLGEPWPQVLLVYVTVLSVWTGIESVHARLNADLPTEEI